MALSEFAPIRIQRISRFGLTTPDAAKLEQFYESAFGGYGGRHERISAADIGRVMAVRGGAERRTLRLGATVVELLQFDEPGTVHAPDPRPDHVAFQHFALVVADMARSLRRLSQVPGWTAVSTEGPQYLPQRAGGVIAFKFRDPDGHPLELLELPGDGAGSRIDAVLRIDHSALSVADTQRSVDFYRAMGLRLISEGMNYGLEQARLDGVTDPRVEITALAPPYPEPHLELLCYATDASRGAPVLHANDVGATRLVIESDSPVERILRDPDGHRLHLIPPARTETRRPDPGQFSAPPST